jgi:hypothetical protein
MRATLRWFEWLLVNLALFAVLVLCFYFAERWLELLECTGHNMSDRLFWEYRPWGDLFYIALFFAMTIGFLYGADRVRDFILKVWRNIFPDDKPNERRFGFWEKAAVVLAAICAALIIGAFNLHSKCP